MLMVIYNVKRGEPCSKRILNCWLRSLNDLMATRSGLWVVKNLGFLFKNLVEYLKVLVDLLKTLFYLRPIVGSFVDLVAIYRRIGREEYSFLRGSSYKMNRCTPIPQIVRFGIAIPLNVHVTSAEILG